MHKSLWSHWALGGLLAGIAYVLADLLLEWRGPRYLPWGGDSTISNAAQMLTGITIIFLIVFAIGYAVNRTKIRT